MRIHKEFTFRFPLRHNRVRNFKIITEDVGELEVEGIGYFDPSVSVLDIFQRFWVDLDLVKWNGTDIKPVLEITGGLEEIEEAATRYVAALFKQDLNNKAA